MRRVLVPLDLAPVVRLAPARPLQIHGLTGATMGTTWSVRLVVPADRSLDEIRRHIERILDGVVAQMSNWIAESDISRFNRAPPGTWCDLPGDFHEVLQYALSVARDSDGAYDPTIGALVELWGFGPSGRRREPPTDDAIAQATGGWWRVQLASGRRALQPGGVQLDVSSVAKGFAVDRVAEVLDRLGIADHLVEIGGELRGSGTKPDGTPWWVALEDPSSDAGALDRLSYDALVQRAPPLPACGESKGGRWPPFLALRNADATHRLWRLGAAGEGDSPRAQQSDTPPHPTPLPASGEREQTRFVAASCANPDDMHSGAPPQTVVALHRLSIATSGDAQRYIEHRGRRLSHTIDPRTGYPVPERMASVTVLHQRCMCADALATALTVLGPDVGFDYAVRHSLAARFLVRRNNSLQERMTPAFAAMLE